MKKILLLSLLSMGALFASPSTKCSECHDRVVKEWSTSAHAMAHSSKNELYSKMANSVAKAKGAELPKVEGQCNLCHAPYDKEGAKEEGVTCVACHKIDSFAHQDTTKPPVGKNMIVWMNDNVMAGPTGKGSSPYHGITQREFMGKNSDQLCLTCHNVMKNEQKITVCSTGVEYKEANQSKSCVDCHMGKPQKGYVSSLSKHQSMVRSHSFHGARNSAILSQAVDLKGKKTKTSLTVELLNLSSHSFPTGTGARLALVTTDFYKGQQIISTKSEKLAVAFTSMDGNMTLPPLAHQIKEDTRLKPNEKRLITYDLPVGFTKAVVSVSYYLASPTLAEKFSLSDERFKKSYPVATLTIK